jgi:uncharacterized membrane protein YtjA (UPF0391 family)
MTLPDALKIGKTHKGEGHSLVDTFIFIPISTLRIERKEVQMLYWAIVFLVVAIIATVFGFGVIAGTTAWIAKVLFIVFLILFVVSLIFGRRGKPPVRGLLSSLMPFASRAKEIMSRHSSFFKLPGLLSASGMRV